MDESLADVAFAEGHEIGRTAGLEAGSLARVNASPDGLAAIPRAPGGHGGDVGAAWSKGWRHGFRANYRVGRSGAEGSSRG